MPPATVSLRTAAILALLVVGATCSFAFHAAMADAGITYTAIQVQPGADADRVAAASSRVVNLDERLDGSSEDVRRPVDRAAEAGSFEGNVSPELDIALDDADADYVVYGGSYYRWNRSADPETTLLRVRMTPAEAEAVFEDVSTPYESAPPATRRTIDDGANENGSVRSGVFRRGDAYYAVAPESDSAVASSILRGFVGYLLTPVGRGYLAVSLGLLGCRYREPLADRMLTARRSAVVAALAIPVALIGTLVFESGSAARFVTAPVSATVVATGVVAGTFAHQRRWTGAVGTAALTAVFALGTNALVHGIYGLVFGAVSLAVGFGFGIVPFGYGLAFARDADAAANAAGAVRAAEDSAGR